MLSLNFIGRGKLRLLVVLSLIIFGLSTQVQAFDSASEFKAKCSGCHTIGGGDLVGPDLKGITEKRDREWLVKFIKDPMGMINGKDPIAVELFKKYRNMPMPQLLNNEKDIESILKYIEGDTAPAQAPVAIPSTFSSVDVEDGRKIFVGEMRLKNGGPQCLSCHQAGNVGGIAGGALGPDLTKVFERFGAAGLKGSLTSIAFPTMMGPYDGKALTEDEVTKLTAFFKSVSEKSELPSSPFKLVIYGTVLLIVLLFFINIMWKSRRTETKRPQR